MTDLPDMLTHSRALIRSLQDPDGAYPASPTFSAYRGFCWFRDGSFIADGMSNVGEAESATAFFDWCGHVVMRHQSTIQRAVEAAAQGAPLPDGSMLPTRFTLCGGLGKDDWWDFQLDGYGTWLWAVCQHASRYGLDLARWRKPIELTTAYLICSGQRPCYDWWEEHCEHVHVSTLGCVAAGLRSVAVAGVLDAADAAEAYSSGQDILELIDTRGIRDGHLVKWLDGDGVDASLIALIAPMNLIEPGSYVGVNTIEAVETDLRRDGGVYRFKDDTFYGGGRWPLLTCFLGLAKAAVGDYDDAKNCLDWAVGSADPAGDLPEQVDGGKLLAPDQRQQWVERWGPVATPLLWSHAMVLKLAAELADISATVSLTSGEVVG